MELPIRVMIVMFVAVVVGGLIILFSQQLLDQSRAQVAELGVEGLSEDRILELGSVQAGDIEKLARQCARDKADTFEESTCYAVFATVQSIPANGTLIGGINISVLVPEGTEAFRIVHAPTEALVEVR